MNPKLKSAIKQARLAIKYEMYGTATIGVSCLQTLVDAIQSMASSDLADIDVQLVKDEQAVTQGGEKALHSPKRKRKK